MKIKLAKTGGFCMGVRRAMELVLAEANKEDGPLYTFGPLIHNKQVMELLESKGVQSVDDPKELETGRIVIRAHGIPPQERRALKQTGLKVIDATCPRVARVQAIIHYYTGKGYTGIIVGDEDHAEVVGLRGYGKTPVHVIKTEGDVRALPTGKKFFVVAQTTQDEENYRQVVKTIKERFPDALVFDTICDATHQRQAEVRSLAGQVDAVVVVGGHHSGNTQRLVQVAKAEGVPTFHVETEKELDPNKLSRMEVIGVTAGASTPTWLIKDVVREIENVRGRRATFLTRWIEKGFRFSVLSNLFGASGAFFFAYAVAVLSTRDPGFTYPALAFLYIFAMHVVNRYLDKGASAYNDPERASFQRKYGALLIGSALAAIVAALIISLMIGVLTFVVLAALSSLGVLYSIPFFPKTVRKHSRYSKIKDIPGSKTLSEALAWVAAIAVLPVLDGAGIAWPALIVTILIVFSMGYFRAALFDLFQVQGDLIAGAETLPITLGEKKTSQLLALILAISAALLAVSPLLGLVPPFSFLMLLPTLTLSLCLLAYEKSWLQPGVMLEAFVEGNFFLAGFLALIWQAIQ